MSYMSEGMDWQGMAKDNDAELARLRTELQGYKNSLGWTRAEKHAAQADAEREKNRADTLYADAMIAHRWFAEHFGEIMNGRDFAVKCPMATRQLEEDHARIRAELQAMQQRAMSCRRDALNALRDAATVRNRFEYERERAEKAEAELAAARAAYENERAERAFVEVEHEQLARRVAELEADGKRLDSRRIVLGGHEFVDVNLRAAIDKAIEQPAPTCPLCKHPPHATRCMEDAPNAQFRCACPGPCPHGRHPAYCRDCAAIDAMSAGEGGDVR